MMIRGSLNARGNDNIWAMGPAGSLLQLLAVDDGMKWSELKQDGSEYRVERRRGFYAGPNGVGVGVGVTVVGFRIPRSGG